MVMLPVGVYWGVQRANTYSRWQTQFRLAQSFTFILEDGSALLTAGPDTLSESTLVAAGNDLPFARDSPDAFWTPGWGHAIQLGRIGVPLDTLHTNFSTHVARPSTGQSNTPSRL